MNTDRLSYFGHAPRGELWEAGGQINGYYHSHQLITEHLDLGAPSQKLHAEDVSCCSHVHPRSPAPWSLWLTTSAHSFSSKNIDCCLIYRLIVSLRSFYINLSACSIKSRRCHYITYGFQLIWSLGHTGMKYSYKHVFCMNSITYTLRKQHKRFKPTVMNPSSRPESGLGGACSRSIDHFSMIDDTWEFSVLRMRNPVMLTPL